ncbi:MAG: metallophosphoesterase [Bacteroidia bacterium]|nr:metallophosphoesterase [Bacteroidia bacterium]
MKHNFCILFLAITITFCSCGPGNNEVKNSATDSTKKDSVLLSFAFVGCNRVQYNDEGNDTATNASTANVTALKRIFTELSAMKNKPDILFFLGDMVCAESTTQQLDQQLQAWVKLYYDTSFSMISKSGIELVAVPGNHEMLFYANGLKVKGHTEFPLEGSTPVWMKYMGPFMPADRDRITGADSSVNQMTFSFVRKNTAFVLMNTDTYNANANPTKKDPYGTEGMIPFQWITNKVAQYKKDPAIKNVFVLGHKPCYIDDTLRTDHDGLPDAPTLWPALRRMGVCAMLSAHYHDYQRMQPGGDSTYQVIAGNGGSQGSAKFYGFSLINIISNGDVKLISKGFDAGNPYYQDVPQNPFTIRDSSILIPGKNENPYNNN